MKETLKNNIKKNETVVMIYDKVRELYYKYLISDEKFIRKQFYNKMGRNVELENPVKFNDKIQWLKLYWYDSIATKCADKYEVREFVSERIGSKYLNELYGVYESVDEIDISKLPQKFVLKGTHGSGFNAVSYTHLLMISIYPLFITTSYNNTPVSYTHLATDSVSGNV